MKKALKVVLCVLGAVVALAALGILFLTITEYRPADVEQLEVISEEHDGGAADPVSPQLQAGEELTVLSWNIGYAGLGEDEDFFMDGGTKKTSADRATVEKYLNGISDTLDELLPDLMMLQEVDVDSARTYRIDESGYVIRGNGVHALNYSCPYVPIPWPPIGRVNSGLFTTTRYEIASAERIALLPAGAYVVNVGRGSAIDQAALIDALNGGRLSGAALDVFAQEPIPAGDPAWTAKNLLITPHISGQMSLGYTRDRNVELFCEDLERYGRGEKPLRLVDRKIGY